MRNDRETRQVRSMTRWVATFVLAATAATSAGAQAPPAGAPPASSRPAGTTPAGSTNGQPTPAADPNLPPDFVIGPDDLIIIKILPEESKMSAEVMVRPDGKVTLPQINDITAAGLTPEQFRLAIVAAAEKFAEGPLVNVTMKEIRSRKVYVQGAVAKPGPYQLTGRMTVLQMLSVAGGLTEYADKSSIGIFREDNGKTVRFKFNWNEVVEGKRMQQNIELKPGDTVVVKE
jgi:polysaccharide biosynthesis/export protein